MLSGPICFIPYSACYNTYRFTYSSGAKREREPKLSPVQPSLQSLNLSPPETKEFNIRRRYNMGSDQDHHVTDKSDTIPYFRGNSQKLMWTFLKK